MLTRLSIRDVVLIDKLDLTLGHGLVVLTGETGAGKSILLDSLGLALGARAEAAMLRSGATQASVTASFELTAAHAAVAIAREQGIESDGELILRRVVGADGRTRAFVNDQPCSVGLLRQLGGALLEIHGQFDNQGLLDAANHRAALDAFAEATAQLELVARAHASWRAAGAAEDDAREAAAKAAQDEAFLRHAEQELAALDPKPDEERQLSEKRQLLASGEKLAEALKVALDELGQHRGVEGALRAAQRQLERVAPQLPGRLDAALAALERAAVEATDAIAEVETLARGLDLDPAALEKTEERLFALKAAARKHRCAIGDLAALREGFAERLAALDQSDARLAALAAATAAARQAYVEVAQALGMRRADSAAKLDKAVARELPALKLEKARFATRLEKLDEREWSADGMERVVFEVATNPGAAPGPLARIASGGELARFMLALKAVLARSQDRTTLVFDEVDSGIGGATATAVGERLARLAAHVQVLAVTHSPQVAAKARQHWRVAKRQLQGRMVTQVEQLDDAQRHEEIARMLAGASITAAARAAARELLADAPSDTKPRRGARA